MAVMLGTAAPAAVCNEHQLIAAARDGDDRAFEELYARYRERIGAFILGRVRDHGRAEDIAQDVFMSALRRLRCSEQTIAFKPWIYEIAKNACIDEFRRSQRTREVSLDSDEELTTGRRALPSAAPTPPAAAESRQRLDDLRGAFGGLSESHHRLLVMREFEGLSYDEIGSRTGMSRQMVESALFRARRKLTEEYDELASGRRCLQVQSAIEDGRAQSVRALGIRERRRLARHLAHCQPCRAMAHLAGVDEALVRPRSIAAKIAALLPFPLLRRPWRGGLRAGLRAGAHPLGAQSLQNTPAVSEPAAAASSLGGAAVIAAMIAIAGAGGAAVTGLSGGHASHAPAAPAVRSSRTNGATAGGRHSATSTAATASARRHAGARLTTAPSHRRAATTSTTGRHGGSAPGAPPSHSAGGHAADTAGRTAGAPTGRAPTQTTTRTVTRTVPGAKRTVTTVTGTVKQTVSGVTSKVSGAVNGVTSAASHTINGVTSTASRTVNGVTSAASGTVKGVTSAASGAVKGTTSAVAGIVSGVSPSAGGAVSGAGSTVGGAVSGAGSAVGGAVSGVGSAVSGTIGGVGSSVSGGVGGVGSSVTRTLNGLG